MDTICSGSFFPFMAASSAGIRLSRIKVVLPEPDTPVTAVILPLGILTANGWTVWIFRVASLMIPLSNICLRAGREVRRSLAFPERNGAIMELGFFFISEIVPSATIFPPAAPACGPSSISQSAADKICVSWSTNMTELPSATKSRITPFKPIILEGCRPMDGSSKTYSTPVVRLRTARASCILCRSPVESVDAARSSER